jgi:hypothetical protein
MVPKLPSLWEFMVMVSVLLAVQEAAIWAFKGWHSRRK